jgi:acyl-lipid omega-6 desaturase (Delta-12 desaturase)
MEAATAVLDPSVQADHAPKRERAWWIEPLEPYAGADLRRSIGCLLTSVVPYVAMWVAMYYSLRVSYWLTLALALPTAGFLVRTFIVFHDCGHGSFMPSKKLNRIVGIISGLLVFNAFFAWTFDHAGHHASSGDLDRRGAGDIDTWTIPEYHAKPWSVRLAYRLLRSPYVMLSIGPLWALAIEPRLIPLSKRGRVWRSHLFTNVGVAAMLVGLGLTVGWMPLLKVQLPVVLIAGAAGVWLFYVQHQFEEAYWARRPDWSYLDAALKGSSYLKLPKVLQFFSGNIGLHHVHHLQPRIPNYNLQRAHDENEFLQDVPTITFWRGMKALNLKLVDEGSGRLVSFAEARRIARLQLDSA